MLSYLKNNNLNKIVKAFVLTIALATTANAKNNANGINEFGDSSKVWTSPAVTVTSSRAVKGESPLPFSELGQKEITNRYLNSDMPKLLSIMPSVIFSSQNGNGIGYSDIRMRGFDQRRIAVMVNGIPQNDPEDHEVYWIDMPDLAGSTENIQVQRGAGMASYGSPSIGGSINIQTSSIANRKGLRVFSGIGTNYFSASKPDNLINRNTTKFSLEYSSGLVDNSAFYVKVSRISSDGYRDRSWAKLQSYFFSYAYFGEALTTQINFFGGPVNDAMCYTGLPKSYIKDANLRLKNYAWGWSYDSTGQNISYASERSKHETEEFSQPHFEILNTYKINDNLLLISSLFYYQGDGFFDGDYSWADKTFNKVTASKFNTNDSNNFKNSFTRAWVRNKQFGWIPKITWTAGSNELTAGFEVRRHKSEHDMNILFADRMPKNYDLDFDLYYYNGYRDILSVFVKDQYKFNENLSVFGDLQVVNHSFRIDNEKFGEKPIYYYNSDKEKVGGEGLLFDVNYVFVNPRLGLNYKVDNNLNFYAFVAHTSREPRMKNLYHASEGLFGKKPMFEYQIVQIDGKDTKIYNFSNPNAKPEKMLDVEVGANYQTDDFNLSANAYFMDYRDEFVKTGKKDSFGTTLDENAAKSRHYGIELSGSAFVFKTANQFLSVWANATFSKNYFVEYDVYFDRGKEQDKVSLAGNEIAGFPSMMSNFGLNYKISDFFASVTGKYVGKFFTDNYNDMLRTNPIIINALRNDWLGYYADNVNDAFVAFDLDLAYTFRNVLAMNSIKLQLQVNNLLNNMYSFSGDGKEFFPAAERSIFLGVELGL